MTLSGHDSNSSYDTYDANVDQVYSSTCAIKSQQIILRDFGIQIPQDELIAYSQEQGWYNGEGSYRSKTGNLLEACGVGIHRSTDNDVNDLIDELKLGHRVIVSVDSRELYAEPGSKEWEFFHNLKSADHALIVAGIKVDSNNPENNVVILTDPGRGDAYVEYPLDHFVGAWGDSRFFMVATDDAAPYQYNAETHCMEYSNFASDFTMQDFPFNNEFSSICDFDETYEPLYGNSGISLDEFGLHDTDIFHSTLDNTLTDDTVSIDSENDIFNHVSSHGLEEI